MYKFILALSILLTGTMISAQTKVQYYILKPSTYYELTQDTNHMWWWTLQNGRDTLIKSPKGFTTRDDAILSIINIRRFANAPIIENKKLDIDAFLNNLSSEEKTELLKKLLKQ